MVTIGMFPGLMLGVEWYDGGGYEEDVLIIDLLFIRILIEF